MKLTTPVNITKSIAKVNYKDDILLLGSCFAQNIGDKLNEHLFNVTINPHGILFNPLSIAHGINDLLANKVYNQNHLQQREDIWFSYNHHGAFSNISLDQCLSSINNQIVGGLQAIKNAKTIVITFGTAWVYRLKETNEIVANCHKMPATLFNKELVNANQIVEVYLTLLKEIKVINPAVNIVFTVSPVRHIKDGVVENSLSKATLLTAVHELIAKVNHTSYFPSYELMIDELRDYRFYKEDLIHPSQQAVDYIWNKFKNSHFDKDTLNFTEKVSKLKRELYHKPLQPNSKAAMAFKEGLQKRVGEFEKEFGVKL